MKNDTVVSSKVITTMFPRYYINNRLVSQSEYVHVSLMTGGKFRVVHDEYRYFLYTGE